MRKRDVKKLIAGNRSVDAIKVTETLKIIRELRKKGVIDERRFEITIPFSKRIRAFDSEPEKVLCFRKLR